MVAADGWLALCSCCLGIAWLGTFTFDIVFVFAFGTVEVVTL